MKVLAGIGTQAGAENGFDVFFPNGVAIPAVVTTLNADGSAEALAVLIAKTKGALNVHHTFRNETKGGSPEVRVKETVDWLELERHHPEIGPWSYARGTADYPHPLVHSVVLMNEPNLGGEHNPEWGEPKTYAAYERMSEEIVEQLRLWEIEIPKRGLKLEDFPLDFPALSPHGDPNNEGTMSPEFSAALLDFWGFIPAGHSAEYRLLFAAYRAYLKRGLRIHFHEYLFRGYLDVIDYGDVHAKNNLKPIGFTDKVDDYRSVEGDDAVRDGRWWVSANRFFDESAPVLQDMFSMLGFPEYENVGCKEFNTGGDAHGIPSDSEVKQSFTPFLEACQAWNDERGGFQIVHADWFLGYTHEDEHHYFLSIHPHRPKIIAEMKIWNAPPWTLPPSPIDVGAPAPPIPDAPSPKPTPPDPDSYDPNPLDLPVGDGLWRAGVAYKKSFISGEHWHEGIRRALFTGTEESPRPGYMIWTHTGAQVFEDADVAVKPGKYEPEPIPPNEVPPLDSPEVQGIDISNLSRYSLLTFYVECMIQDHGIRTAVVGIYPFEPEIAKYQLQELSDGGIDHLQVYGEPTTTLGARFRDVIEIAISTGLEIARYWIDVEPVPSLGHVPTREDLDRAIEECERAGVPYGIYSGTWAWKFGAEYAEIPVWWASYISGPAPSAIAEMLGVSNPFSAWSPEKVLGWQYRGTHQMCGVSVDANLFRIKED